MQNAVPVGEGMMLAVMGIVYFNLTNLSMIEKIKMEFVKSLMITQTVKLLSVEIKIAFYFFKIF